VHIMSYARVRNSEVLSEGDYDMSSVTISHLILSMNLFRCASGNYTWGPLFLRIVNLQRQIDRISVLGNPLPFMFMPLKTSELLAS
jgi:hypothetical protein